MASRNEPDQHTSEKHHVCGHRKQQTKPRQAEDSEEVAWLRLEDVHWKDARSARRQELALHDKDLEDDRCLFSSWKDKDQASYAHTDCRRDGSSLQERMDTGPPVVTGEVLPGDHRRL